MANVRCPMCSKLNESDVEVCAFCGARLKPLRPSSSPQAEGDSIGGSEEDEPAWLRELRSDDQQAGDDVQDTVANLEGSEVPDWLSRIRQKAHEDTDVIPDQQSTEEEGQPDWLKDFRPEAGETGDAGLESDDWLGRIQPGEAAQPEPGGDLDWNTSLAPTPVQPDSPEGDQGLSGFGLTGFLASLESTEAGQAEPSSALPAQELPAWDHLPGEQPGFELPEWRQSEQGEAGEGLPDWLTGPEQEGETPPAFATPGGQEDLPDWLNSLVPTETGDQEPVSGPVESGQGEAAPGELPDWFASITDLDQESQGERPPTESEDSVVTVSGLPDWLNEEDEPLAEAGVTRPEVVLPDDVGQEEPALVEPAAALPMMEDSVPDWLRDMPGFPSEGEEVFLPSVEEEELPQLAGMEADQPFPSGELSGWLSEAADEPVPEMSENLVAQPTDGELAAAELPDWVREMRPIESVDLGEPVTPEIDQLIERAGPLAGMRGILQAEDTATRYRKPPVYSARLRVSEKQRSQASLLESILEQETQPLLIPPGRASAQHLIGRILTALLWLAVITIAFVLPLGLEPAPMRTPPELEEMFNQIDQSAQTDRPVLLAVDFEPALAGEMTLAAQPVVEHLMSRNIRIVIVSTAPAGPVLVQSLLDGAAQTLAGQEQEYDLVANVVNLGYLPGGTISLLEFAQLPRQAAPASIVGDYTVWDQPVLALVKSLGDFSQVIVVTDSAEVGRNWVEQVKPLMGDIPLLMVASAQAEPLLMPYVDSGQIDGLTGGLLGGVLYSQWRQIEPAAGAYWPAFQVGIGLAFLLVLVGGLVSAGVALIKRGDQGEA